MITTLKNTCINFVKGVVDISEMTDVMIDCVLILKNSTLSIRDFLYDYVAERMGT